MATNKIRGLTIEIGADTDEFNSKVGALTTQMNKTHSELTKVNTLLKFNPKNTELLAQKQKLLGDQVATTKEKLDKLKDAEKKVQEQFQKGDMAEDQYRAFQREIVETESKLKHYKNQVKEVEDAHKRAAAGTDELAKKFDNMGGKLKNIGGNMSKYFTAPIVGGAVAAVKGTEELRVSLGMLETNAQQASISGKSVEKMLVNLAGVSEDTDANVEALSNLLATGFSENGIANAVDYLSGAVIKFPDTLKIEGLADGLQETLATGQAIGPFAEMLERLGYNLDDFNAGLADAQANGQAENYILQTLSKSGLAETNDAFRKNNESLVKNKESAQEFQLQMAELGDKLQPLITTMTDFASGALEKFNEMSPTGQKVVFAIGGIIAVIGPLLMILGSMATGIGSLITLFGAGGAAAGVLGGAIGMLTGPIGIAMVIIAGLTAAGVFLYKNWDTIMEKAKALFQGIKDTFGKIKETIASAFNFKFTWPKLTLPKFKITGSMNPLKWIEEGTPKLSVNWNAEGAIFTKPYIFGNQGVGEAGPEAVLPISKLAGMMADVMRKMGTQQQPALAGVTHNHTGVIRVEGVNNRGETMDVVNIVMDQLRREVRK